MYKLEYSIENAILEIINDECKEQYTKNGIVQGVSTSFLADKMKMQRTNTSSVLNKLYIQGKIIKIKGKPVLYSVSIDEKSIPQKNTYQSADFDVLMGSDKSLKKSIQQAKAAMLYPPSGLHTLILGATGVGKTMFAELMYRFAVQNKILPENAPYVSFNCSDYADNPQLLLSYLFGCKKGAYTGADKDRPGIVQKADKGILFLDEIHRLPPTGQEMLFYLIDKGEYTPLGEVGTKKKCEVLLICATTEDVNSSLLNTFTRRIPMNIILPSLKDRTLDERFELICEFFKIESKRIGKEIEVSDNALRSLLLYDCVGNVGQLKSDIKLGCANAFLRSISSKSPQNIIVQNIDLSDSVKHGIFYYKKQKNKIDKLIKNESRLIFKAKEIKEFIENTEEYNSNNFYELIEKRVDDLLERGVDKNEINLIMSIDIENYFNKYIWKFNNNVNNEQLSEIVGNNVMKIVKNFIDDASEKLNRIYSNKIFVGLCFHVSSAIERLKQNKKIINYNLKEIEEKNNEEYFLAKDFINILSKKYNMEFPLDEAGFISMFLCTNNMLNQPKDNKPVVIVAMHGNATASSMAEVANTLIGEGNVIPYDIKLNENPKIAYENLKNIIQECNAEAGVLLLVDMGSLSMFGELISEETGIKIKSIDMVSTPVVIECSRKAAIECDIEKIWEEIMYSKNKYLKYDTSLFETYIPNKNNIIITLCTTGEGSAIKLKNMIEEKIDIKAYNTQIIPLAINNVEYLYKFINKISKEKNIKAVIGTTNPNIYGIPFISISSLLSDKNYSVIRDLFNDSHKKCIPHVLNDDDLKHVFEAIEDEVNFIEIEQYKTMCIDLINKLHLKFNTCNQNVIIGLILHLTCTINKILNNENIRKCFDKDFILSKYPEEFMYLKNCMMYFERKLNLIFIDDELCFMLKIVMCI